MVIFIYPYGWLMIIIYELLNDVKIDKVSGYFMLLLSMTYTLEDAAWRLIILIWNTGAQLWRKKVENVAFYDLRNEHVNYNVTRWIQPTIKRDFLRVIRR